MRNMKTFNLRVRNLLDKTLNEDVKNECLKVLDVLSVYSPNEIVIRNVMLENLLKIENLTDIEQEFIKNEQKVAVLSDMGLGQVLNEILSNQEMLRANPQMLYALNPIKISFENKSHSVTYLAERLLSVLRPYSFVPFIQQHINGISKLFETYAEEILTYNAINYISKMRSSNFYSSISEKLHEYLFSEISRDQLISELNKYSYENFVQNLIKQYNSFSGKKELSVINENKDFRVDAIHSFVYFDPEKKDKIYFTNNGYVFCNENSEIRILENEEVSKLPQTFLNLNRHLLNKNISISENKVTMYIDDGKLVYETLDQGNKAFYNNMEIVDKTPYEFMMQVKTLNTKQYDQLWAAKEIWENLDTLIEIDFGKNIISNFHNGLSATLFKVNEKFYTHLVNYGMKKNEFLTDGNALQVKNAIKEFMNYDISESLYEYLEGVESELGKLNSQQKTITEAILDLNKQLLKIEDAMVDEAVASNQEVLELKKLIIDQISELKSQWSDINTKINELNKFNEKVEVKEEDDEKDECEEDEKKTKVKEEDEEEKDECEETDKKKAKVKEEDEDEKKDESKTEVKEDDEKDEEKDECEDDDKKKKETDEDEDEKLEDKEEPESKKK